MTTDPAPKQEGYNTDDIDEKLPEYSWEEVATHNTETDLWIVLYNRIYDVTEFRIDHPGGEDVLLDLSGQDATESFENILHTEKARKMTKKYLIGRIRDGQLGDLFEEVRPLDSGSNKNPSMNDASNMNTLFTLAFLGLAAFLAYQYYIKN